ncbi:MAG TPA: MlaD family protein [Burkholderiales bacterium]|nr:MlaD family protein [Burkholderiales bacterium]
MEREPGFNPLPKNLQFRVGMLVGLAVVLGAGFLVYTLFARGFFDDSQRLTLITENAEGVSIGMDLTFSGFPIGRVERLALDPEGRARIVIEVPRKDSRWLRQSSVFTLERGLFGGASIRAHTGNLKDAPLPDGAERPVLRGDTSEEIPRLVASVRSILDNVENLTSSGGHLQASMASLRALTDKAAGKQGALGALLGNEQDVERLLATLDQTNALLASLKGLTTKAEGLVGKTDQRLFSSGGVMEQTERAVAQANAMLAEVRETLKRADTILADAEKISGNAKAATQDLATLRAEVDASVRKISGLIDEINRKWPFERKHEIRLP